MENSNKNSKKGLAIVLIIIAVIVAGVLFYFFRPVSAKETFVRAINSTIDYSKEKYLKTEETTNTTITLSGKIDTQAESGKEIANYINQSKLMFNVQADTKNKRALLSADVDYQNENLLSGKIFYQNDGKIYFYVQDLFDKYFKYDINELLNDEEDKGQIKEFLTGTASEKNDMAKASQILKGVISENLKDEYFSKENTNGMTKNTMKLSSTDIGTLAKNIATSLKDNQEFLSCFEKKEEMKKMLENVSKNETTKQYNAYLEVSIYTKGLKKEFVKAECAITSNGETVKFTIKNEKIDNNTQKLTIETDEIKDFGKVTLNIEVKNTNTTDLDNINVSDSVNINEISTQDTLKLYTNLTKMKLYKYIQPFFMQQQ